MSNKNTTITTINNDDDYIIDKSKFKRKIKIVLIIMRIIIAYLIYTVIRRKNIVPYQLQVDN